MRHLLAIAFCSLLATAGASAQPDWTREGGARVRTTDQRSAALLREGLMRSSTLRGLVDRVESGDVIVYVGTSPLRPVLSGQLTWMTRAGGFRYVRITLNTDRPPDHIISTLGHELQHAVEVIEHPSVIDERSMVSLYKRIGHENRALGSPSWETEAAQETTSRVRRELVSLVGLRQIP